MSNERSRREFEMYMLIVTKALSIRQIAERLGMSYMNARSMQHRILEKMNMGSALELLIQYHRKEAA